MDRLGSGNELIDLQRRVDKLERSYTLGNAAVTRGVTRFIGDESLTIEGSGRVSGTLFVDGFEIVNGTLQVNGSLLVTGDTEISGPTSIVGDTVVSGTFAVSGPLNVTGPATIAGTTDITGATSITGATEISGDLTATGNTELNGPTEVNGAMSVVGGTFTAGNTIIDPNSVTGGIKFSTGGALYGIATSVTLQGPGGNLIGLFPNGDIVIQSGSGTITARGESIVLESPDIRLPDLPTISGVVANAFVDPDSGQLGVQE